MHQIPSIPQLTPSPAWWVAQTPEGWKALPYRANSRTRTIGPFSTRDTAAMKIQELETERQSRRRLLRCAAVCTAVMVTVTVLLQVLP